MAAQFWGGEGQHQISRHIRHPQLGPIPRIAGERHPLHHSNDVCPNYQTRQDAMSPSRKSTDHCPWESWIKFGQSRKSTCQPSVQIPYDSSLAWRWNNAIPSNKAIARTPSVKVSSHRTKSLLSSCPLGTLMPRRMSTTGCSSKLYMAFVAAPNIGMIRFVRYFIRLASIKTHMTPVS